MTALQLVAGIYGPNHSGKWLCANFGRVFQAMAGTAVRNCGSTRSELVLPDLARRTRSPRN